MREMIILLAATMVLGSAHADEPSGLLLIEPNESIIHQSGQDLRVIELPSNRKRRIPNTTGVYWARLSPDGCKIAFLSSSTLWIGLWKANNFRSFSAPQLYSGRFEWSNDMRRLNMQFGFFDIATASFTRHQEPRERIIREGLSGQLQETYLRYPNAWSAEYSISPDGLKEVYFGFNGMPQHRVLLNGNQTLVLGDIGPPLAWSADSESFVAHRGNEFGIYTVADGSWSPVTISNFAPAVGRGIGPFQISPDKRWIAYSTGHVEDIIRMIAGNYSRTYLARRDGTGRRSIGRGSILSWVSNPGKDDCKD